MHASAASGISSWKWRLNRSCVLQAFYQLVEMFIICLPDISPCFDMFCLLISFQFLKPNVMHCASDTSINILWKNWCIIFVAVKFGRGRQNNITNNDKVKLKIKIKYNKSVSFFLQSIFPVKARWTRFISKPVAI